MKKFIITEELAQAILNYLASRPYVEAVKLISGLQQLEELKESEKKDK